MMVTVVVIVGFQKIEIIKFDTNILLSLIEKITSEI